MIHAEIAIDSDGEGRRAEPRVDTRSAITLRPQGSAGAEAELINISSRGFMAETDADLAPGTRVWLRLPGIGRINATVIWSDGDRLGGEFVEAVDPLEVIQAAGAALAR
jgi:hypothetical protein